MAHVTIPDTSPRVQYSVGGTSTTDFSIPFAYFEEGDIVVYVGSTLKTLTTDYTITGTAVDEGFSGGTVVLNTGVTNTTVTVVRDVAVERITDFATNGPFNITQLNSELDRITAQIQQNESLEDYFLKVADYDTYTDLTLPDFDTRKGKFLYFDSTTGDPEAYQVVGVWQGSDATTTTADYVKFDIVKDSSNSNVYICTADSTTGTLLTNTSYWALLVDAATATSSATAAAASATAAASSATAAASSATAAAASETAAGTSETNAATSASSASTSATAAASSATSAASSATAAASSETAAAASESAAASSETAAATSASNAATSATNAASSATTATTQASAASTSATNAATSASAASTSASNAATSETNAATSATAAQAALDSIENFYLGAEASAPTVDDNGDPLEAGDWYFNTTDNLTYIYNGSSWQVTVVDTSGLVSTSGDSMTGDLSFGDNDKAIFGDGSDLQIYHDGSHSYIKDVGGGNLYIYTDGASCGFVDGINSRWMVRAIPSGAAELYYTATGQDKKLATTSTGVSVTGRAVGTTTTDNDLSFDMQASNNFSCTPTGTGTLTFTNITSGQSGNIYLDNSGGHVISAAATTFISAADLTKISTAGKYFVSYYSADGTNVLVSASSAVTASGA